MGLSPTQQWAELCGTGIVRQFKMRSDWPFDSSAYRRMSHLPVTLIVGISLLDIYANEMTEFYTSAIGEDTKKV